MIYKDMVMVHDFLVSTSWPVKEMPNPYGPIPEDVRGDDWRELSLKHIEKQSKEIREFEGVFDA